MDMNLVMKSDSKYLAKGDVSLQGADAVMANVTIEEVGDDQKPILYFMGGQLKPMVLNKTNVAVLTSLYGPESDHWQGKQVCVYNDPSVSYQGVATGGVRLRPSAQQPAGVNIAQNTLQGAPDVPPSPPVESYEAEQKATAASLAQFQDSEVPF